LSAPTAKVQATEQHGGRLVTTIALFGDSMPGRASSNRRARRHDSGNGCRTALIQSLTEASL
jgi:hypothetical protein